MLEFFPELFKNVSEAKIRAGLSEHQQDMAHGSAMSGLVAPD